MRLGWRAERLERSASGLEVHGRGARGEGDEALDGLSAEAAVVALPHAARRHPARAAAWVSTARALDGLGSSPIVNLHVVYDRPVLDEPFAAGVGTPVQYLFDRTAPPARPRAASIWLCRCPVRSVRWA